MRQAGRSLPEYRAVRGEGSILDAIKQPDLAAEITLQPVRRYGVDAAVLYSDIVVPAHAVGFGIDVAPGTGPVCRAPAAHRRRPRPPAPARRGDRHRRTWSRPCDSWSTSCPDEVPLLAFAGAPFTVASYLIEGRPSRTYQHTKRMMHTEPELWHAVMDRLVQHSVAFIDAPAATPARGRSSCSTRGPARCPRRDYDRFVLPHSHARCSRSSPSATRARPASTSASAATTCSSRCSAPPRRRSRHARARPRLAHPDHARRGERMGDDLVVQGNLDPALVLAGHDAALAGTDAGAGRQRPGRRQHPGHIFNLGHGVQPDTDPEVLAAVVDHVHAATAHDRATGAAP